MILIPYTAPDSDFVEVGLGEYVLHASPNSDNNEWFDDTGEEDF